MKVIKAQILCAAFLLALGMHFPASRQTWIGARGCGTWVKNADEKNIGQLAQKAWLAGYLSVANDATSVTVDVLDGQGGQNFDSLALWVYNYCKSNPLDNAAIAAGQLFLELIERAKQRGKR